MLYEENKLDFTERITNLLSTPEFQLSPEEITEKTSKILNSFLTREEVDSLLQVGIKEYYLLPSLENQIQAEADLKEAIASKIQADNNYEVQNNLALFQQEQLKEIASLREKIFAQAQDTAYVIVTEQISQLNNIKLDKPNKNIRTKIENHLTKLEAVLATLGGAKGWEDIETYGVSHQRWLSEFLALPFGIPSADTYRRLFERISPSALERSFNSWLSSLVVDLGTQVIPIDGKTVKGSYDRNGEQSALHLVSAWASENRLFLGQVKVEDKSNGEQREKVGFGQSAIANLTEKPVKIGVSRV